MSYLNSEIMVENDDTNSDLSDGRFLCKGNS